MTSCFSRGLPGLAPKSQLESERRLVFRDKNGEKNDLPEMPSSLSLNSTSLAETEWSSLFTTKESHASTPAHSILRDTHQNIAKIRILSRTYSSRRSQTRAVFSRRRVSIRTTQEQQQAAFDDRTWSVERFQGEVWETLMLWGCGPSFSVLRESAATTC